MADSKDNKSAKDLVIRVRERTKLMQEADDHNRHKAIDDFKFVNVPGNQWDEKVKKKRGKRPCWEYNKLRIKCKRIINEARANRPQGKVRGVEDSDKKTADIYDGLIRNIWTTSDADTVVDGACEYQVSAGFGAWRIDNEYIDSSAFDQHLKICDIVNPLNSLWWDPSDQSSTKDKAMDWVLLTRISKDEYERRWPNKKVVNFESDVAGDTDDWQDEETVQIAEYHYKEPYTKTLHLTKDGRTLDDENAKLEPPENLALDKDGNPRTREAQCFKIYSCIVSGDAVLEKPQLLAGEHHRFVVIFGDHYVIDGKEYWSGLVRFSRDQQISYNLSRTAIDESVLSAPNQSKWWATVDQAKGHEAKWNQAFEENIPWLAFNQDPKNPGAPQAMNFNPLNPALVKVAEMNDRDMANTSGIEDDNLGIETSAKSGRAIIAKQNQGAIATFNYQDNMAKGHRRTYEILIDLIPHYYDTQRTLRILGPDGSEDYVKINDIQVDPATGQAVTVNDLSVGTYDVTVTVGPSFTTRRQEAAQAYGEIATTNPAVMGVAGDLVFKALDLPYSDEIADRMKAMLPPQIQQQLAQGKDVPPEVAQGMARVEQASQLVQQQTQLLNQAQAEVDQAKTDAEKATAQLKVERAQLAADKARAEADLALKQAQLILKQAQDSATASDEKTDAAHEQMGTQLQQVLVSIQDQQAQFMAQVMQMMADLMAKQQPMVVMPPKQKIKSLRMVRQNGQTTAVPEYETEMMQ